MMHATKTPRTTCFNIELLKQKLQREKNPCVCLTFEAFFILQFVLLHSSFSNKVLKQQLQCKKNLRVRLTFEDFYYFVVCSTSFQFQNTMPKHFQSNVQLKISKTYYNKLQKYFQANIIILICRETNRSKHLFRKKIYRNSIKIPNKISNYYLKPYNISRQKQMSMSSHWQPPQRLPASDLHKQKNCMLYVCIIKKNKQQISICCHKQNVQITNCV
eukprot:TRINITY_DN2693_c1_g4_i1.p1 TRINITY_DN2693_c1_g4~~TRINITY_DN2693_c1_g4_i1.p1  ORF type:complete len:216 (+),score=-12.00 TRINITY_DN2693_c1_g4_i1:181-828(+)